MTYSPDESMKEERASSGPKKLAGRSRFQFTILDLIGLNVLIAVDMLIWRVLIRPDSKDPDIAQKDMAALALSVAHSFGAAYLTFRLATEREIEFPLWRFGLMVTIEFFLFALIIFFFSLFPVVTR